MPKFKTGVACILLLSAAFAARAQNNNSTQQQSPAGFKLVFEKAYLHTDRDVYVPGDTLWYKAYLVNTQTNIPTTTSGTLYVDLIASDAHIIHSKITKLTGGLGNGDFQLPDTLQAGNYRLRAYTNWMRNFGDTFIFEKNITILNSAETKIPAAPKNIKLAKPGKPAATRPAIATATVNFYPESGAMLEGLSGLVAVKAENGAGRGVAVKGVVISSAGDTVSHFICDSLGMGLFALLPVSGQHYRAVVQAGGKTITGILPMALSKGLALQVSKSDSILRVIINSNIAPKNTIPLKYIITFKHEGRTLGSQEIQMQGPQTTVKIPLTGLPEGIVSVTLYDEQNKPNCERLVYISHPGNTVASVLTDKKSYQPYQKTTLDIQTSHAANLSVAVVDASVTPEQEDNIQAYLLLGSELRGHIEQIRRYFDTTNVNRVKQLDLLLMTQGWRDFVWRKLADTTIHISYAAESGISISGLVEEEVNHKPLLNFYVALFTDTTGTAKSYGQATNAQGRFLFTDVQLKGKSVVKLNVLNANGHRYGTFILDTVSHPLVTKTAAPVEAMTDTILTDKLLHQSAEIKKINGAWQLKEVIIKAKVPVWTSTYDKNHIVLDNGNHYLTWGEQQSFKVAQQDLWTKTLTWFVQQKFKNILTRANGPGVYVILDGTTVVPDLVVNGSTFHIDPNLYWNMPVEKFKKVDLVSTAIPPKAFFFLTTIDNVLTDSPGLITATINGYDEARTFYAPNYAAGSPSIPDYRTLLHWQPDIKTDTAGHAKISFYNAQGTRIRVIVQGITNTGVPVNAETTYMVQ